MKLSRGLLILAFTIICGLIVSCSPYSSVPEPPKVNQYPPFETKGYTEQPSVDDKTRYVIADIQLGGKPVEDYYRQYADQDPVIRQAIQYHDNDVRIVNIYQFDRVNIENEGWTVIYGGTDNIICQGKDIVLTEDIGATGNDEARMRYIIADIQLGNVAEYYRQYSDEKPVVDALARWDIGVRVVNINLFERKIVNVAGWRIVYAGTENTINGMDAILSDDEARIRYIMADIQLGGVADYYRQFPNDPLAREALNRWDSGIRVENINDFERKTVGTDGWQVVYSGTVTTIDGMDVILTEHQLAKCNPESIQLTPEEQAHCGRHYYSQALTFLAINESGDSCGFYNGTNGSEDGHDSNSPAGSYFPPNKYWEFTFHQDGLDATTFEFVNLARGGIMTKWRRVGTNMLLLRSRPNTYTIIYEDAYSVYGTTVTYTETYVIKFGSSSFSVEMSDTQFAPGLCGSMNATLLPDP
jgi:hypothetical protein